MILDNILLCFLAVAAIQDYDKAKIANFYIVVMMAVGLAIRIYNRDCSSSVVWAMLGIFVVFFGLYCMKAMGAGDVKLIMASAVYIDRNIWIVTGIALLLGAVWGLFKLVRARVLMARLLTGIRYLTQVLGTGKGMSYWYGIRSGQEITVPFAVCLCGGYVIWYLYHMLVKGGVI